MNEKKLVQNFKSYINVSPKNNGEKNGSVQEVEPNLLNGELVVGAAHSVVMLTPLTERDSGRFGSLFVTNYKLSFIPFESSRNNENCQRNILLGTYDVPLTAVGAVWLTDGGSVRRRQLVPYRDMPDKVKGLQIICKNMKVLTFSFANSPIGSGKKIAMSLIHHAFPKRHDLLFAYEYREPYYPTLPSDLNMFQRPGDWKRELERCDCPHWRITCINGTSDAFMTAGDTLIVPNSVLDYNLLEATRHYRSGRVPIWVWGRPEGAALLRSGELLQTEKSTTAESVLLEQVRRSHPKLLPPHVIYLCGNPYSSSGSGPTSLPSLATLQTSYNKLVDLCTPSTLGGFWIQDSQYYSILDSSRWLRYVSNCLAFADDAAKHLAFHNQTVVLLEGDGVDYCAVVSSLTQLLLDPHARTLVGFQSLVQKEWVALGHPFADRSGLPRPGSTKDSPRETMNAQTAPVFLLFLDCAWQLLRQFPASFQYTEIYLATLWDCAHNHLFDTFLFNCPRDRDLAIAKHFIQRPVWDWNEQFSEQDQALFYNPLYTPPINKLTNTPNQRLSLSSVSSKASIESSRLEPCTSIADVELWALCYERWLLPLDAPHAGPVQYHVHNFALVNQIRQLNEKLSSLSILSNRQSNGDQENSSSRPPTVCRFYPFSASRGGGARSVDAMQLSLIDATQLLDSQSLLNAPD